MTIKELFASTKWSYADFPIPEVKFTLYITRSDDGRSKISISHDKDYFKSMILMRGYLDDIDVDFVMNYAKNILVYREDDKMGDKEVE